LTGVDLQPTLKGQLLELRPLRSTDFDDLYRVASDPLIWALHPDNDRYKPDVFRRFFDDALKCNGALVAIDLKSSEIIGSSRFHGYDEDRSEVEIGWTYLARAFWGGVYNGEMKDLMLRHAFGFVRNVIFVVGAENWRSQRAVEKIGAVRAGSRPRSGGRVDFVYRITAAAFEARTGKMSAPKQP